MKIVLSPAKTLNFDADAPTGEYTQCVFLDNAEKINAALKKKSPKELSKLMNISANLGALNWQRNQDWKLPFSLENAKQAIFAFNGDVYTGLDVFSLPLQKIDRLQKLVRILSGQYGLLKPLDLIQPYRLEMGTKLKIGRKENLYQFWGAKITEMLNAEMVAEEVLLNLASNEYFKALKPTKLQAKVITPVFKDYKDGNLKTISFFAKKARGLMVRFIVDHNIEKIEDLKGFDYEGYGFDANLSSEKELVFTR